MRLLIELFCIVYVILYTNIMVSGQWDRGTSNGNGNNFNPVDGRHSPNQRGTYGNNNKDDDNGYRITHYGDGPIIPLRDLRDIPFLDCTAQFYIPEENQR